jgi:hypothetical protein
MDLLQHSKEILAAFLRHPETKELTLAWANTIIKERYARSIKELTKEDKGFHFHSDLPKAWSVAKDFECSISDFIHGWNRRNSHTD